MSVFDPYDRSQPATPGLNTGSQTQVSTLSTVETGGLPPSRYRSGLLSVLAPFLGWASLLLGAAAGAASLLAWDLCGRDRLDAVACSTPEPTLALVPAGMAVLGLVLAGIAGSLVKRRKNATALVVIAGAVLGQVALTSWFSSSVLGLPFP